MATVIPLLKTIGSAEDVEAGVRGRCSIWIAFEKFKRRVTNKVVATTLLKQTMILASVVLS